MRSCVTILITHSRTNCIIRTNKLYFKCQTIKASVATPDRDTQLHVSPAWTKPIAFVIIHFHGMACHKIDEIHFAGGAANRPVSLMRGLKPHLLSELCTLLFYWQYFPFGRQTQCVCPELSTPAAHLPSDHLSAPGFCFSQSIKVLPHHLEQRLKQEPFRWDLIVLFFTTWWLPRKYSHKCLRSILKVSIN